METSASFEARSAPPPYPAETSVGQGGPKRARSRKRRTEAKGSLQPTKSPLLGEGLTETRKAPIFPTRTCKKGHPAGLVHGLGPS